MALLACDPDQYRPTTPTSHKADRMIAFRTHTPHTHLSDPLLARPPFSLLSSSICGVSQTLNRCDILNRMSPSFAFDFLASGRRYPFALNRGGLAGSGVAALMRLTR